MCYLRIYVEFGFPYFSVIFRENAVWSSRSFCHFFFRGNGNIGIRNSAEFRSFIFSVDFSLDTYTYKISNLFKKRKFLIPLLPYFCRIPFFRGFQQKIQNESNGILVIFATFSQVAIPQVGIFPSKVFLRNYFLK